jgi:hypothetical protein
MSSRDPHTFNLRLDIEDRGSYADIVSAIRAVADTIDKEHAYSIERGDDYDAELPYSGVHYEKIRSYVPVRTYVEGYWEVVANN